MKQPSKLLSSLPSSMTLVVNDKARALRRSGKDVIILAGGDPNFKTPKHIVDAAFDAINNGATSYPSPARGIVPAMEAIAQKFEADSGVAINPMTDVVITPGGKWALNLALRTVLNPGEEILYFDPVWVSYPPMIELNGGVPVGIELDSADNFKITAAAIEAKITPKTKALMLTSPCNPTGRVVTREEVDAVVSMAIKYDLYVLYDELYEKLIYDGGQHIPLSAEPGMQERTFTINGLSKAYAMTGWRLGWLVGPTNLMKLAAKMHSQTITGAAHFVMHAAVAALNGPQDEISAMRDAYCARRDFMVGALNEIPGISCANIEGAFYLFPKFTQSSRNSLELAEALLDKALVAGTPGEAFGVSANKHIRFSIATAMEDLERAVERIAKIATEL